MKCPICLISSLPIGAEWKAYHCSCREEPLWCLCLRGQQHSGSEREQSCSPVCARWEDDTLPTRSEHPDDTSNQSHAQVSHVWPKLLLSPPAAKPMLVLKPENVSVRLGESAHFYCQAKGDPPPAVLWSRDQGPLPNGRYLILEGHRDYILMTLWISHFWNLDYLICSGWNYFSKALKSHCKWSKTLEAFLFKMFYYIF